MNTECKKVLLESLKTVHQAMNNVQPVELPDLVHAEIEILTTIDKANQATKFSENLNQLFKAAEAKTIAKPSEPKTNVDDLLNQLRNLGGGK